MEKSVYEIFREKASRAREEADKRSLEARTVCPEIGEIEDELSQTGMRIFGLAVKNHGEDNGENASLFSRIEYLKKRKADLLSANGFPKDYTDVKYECKKCSDTGYVGIKMCDCMKSAIAKENYKNSGIGKYLEKQSFDNFKLDYYSDKVKTKSGLTVRKSMERVLDICRKYAENFDENADSLFFVGGTGLGKTHLSSSIAKAVIDKGYSVVYESAQNILSAFEKERFQTDGTFATDRFFSSDLLIIDDLGTEIQGKSSVSYFYNLINTRLIASKATIISTNLTPDGLRHNYEDRVVSRLFGEYKVFLFEGEDIRKIK